MNSPNQDAASGSITHTEEVPAALADERLDRVVSMLTDLSRSAAARLIVEGQVRLDGEVALIRSIRLSEGQRLEITVENEATQPKLIADSSVVTTVVYSDEHVIVVDKPAGLVVHPGAGNTSGTLIHGLLAQFPELAEIGAPERPGLVHRIDKGTSGLMVVARSAVAYEDLSEQFSRHSTTREYQALVWGELENSEGLIDAPLGRSGRDATRMTVAVGGREARTRYQVLKRFSDPLVTLLQCQLDTGRTHQIRVHLSAIKHPIVGDDVYGRLRPAIALPRPFLHAARLVFTHPGSGDEMAFTSALPVELEAVLQTLS